MDTELKRNLAVKIKYRKVKTQLFTKNVSEGYMDGLIYVFMSCNDLTQEELEKLRRQWKKGGRQNE